MRNLVIGLCIGILATGTAWFLVVRPSEPTSPTIERFPGTTPPTSAAGVNQNFANQLPAKDQIALSLLVSESGGNGQPILASDLISLELTFAKAEAHLIEPASNMLPITTEPVHWEVLELTQPTIELFALRGSGALAELGITQLAPGRYDAVRLSLSGAKGRRANGQVVDLNLSDKNQTLTIERDFRWSEPTQLILDFDIANAIVKNADGYQLTPKLRRLIQNDEEV